MKYEKDCKDCHLQKKSEVCRKCKDYWVGRTESAFMAQAVANGKLGAMKKLTESHEKTIEIQKSNLGTLTDLANSQDKRYHELLNTVRKVVAKIQTSTIFQKKKTLQETWQTLTDLLHE